jgi:RNA polymerase sigma-70 factor (ECF subfamily)
VDEPKAFLFTIVAHLCLDELGSARARHEDIRSDRLPEPIDLNEAGMGRVEMIDRISMAFLVLLLVSVEAGKIRHVFVQGDPERLRHIGPSS